MAVERRRAVAEQAVEVVVVPVVVAWEELARTVREEWEAMVLDFLTCRFL